MKISIYWRPVFWLAIMCGLLFMPANELPKEPFLYIPHIDKMVHFFMFLMLCIFMFRPTKAHTPNFYFWAPLLTLLFATLLESIQQQVSPTRSTDVFDFLANVSGLLSAPVFYRLFIQDRKHERFF